MIAFYSEIPVASVMAFAGNLGKPNSLPDDDSSYTAPTVSPPQTSITEDLEAWGWMLCDGRSLSTGLYPRLFAALGYQYGGKDNIFKIPDYRGYFLRGVDGGSGNDPDISSRNPPTGGSGKNSEVGSIQADSLKYHSHQYDTAPVSTTPAGKNAAGATSNTQAFTEGTFDNKNQHSSDVNPDETRPKNIYVNYIIKFI